MKSKLQLSEVMESITRGKSYLEVQVDLYDLEELCQKTDNPKLLEYVPVKIVACFEQFFRDEYKEILYNPKTKKRLKEVDAFKNAKFDFDIIGAFEDNTITLGDYLSYLVPCSRLEDINNTLSQLLHIKFFEEISKKKKGKQILQTVDEVFRLRHIYCHEVPFKDTITREMASRFISDACDFLEFSDDTIRNSLYSDNRSLMEEFEIAKRDFEKTDKELEELLEQIRLNENKESLFYNDLNFIDKWKEYREVRAKSESSVNHGESYLPQYYYRSMERATRTLIKELKDDFKYELRR